MIDGIAGVSIDLVHGRWMSSASCISISSRNVKQNMGIDEMIREQEISKV